MHGAGHTVGVRLHHVGAVAGCAVTCDLAVNLMSTAPAGELLRFQQQHRRATGDDEAVTIAVERARGRSWVIVAARRKRAHRVKEYGRGPTHFFGAADEGAVDQTMTNHLVSVANAVCRRGAGGGDRVARPADPKGLHQVARGRATHHLRHVVGQQLLQPALTKDGQRLVMAVGRADAGTDDQRRARVTNLVDRDSGVVDGLAHGMPSKHSGVGHVASQLARNDRLVVEGGDTRHLAGQTQFGILWNVPDAAT